VKIDSVTFRTSAANLEGCPRAPLPEIAVSGRSNVGKSSLLNALCKRKGLAKVSSTPGKTQLLNFFLINERFHLVDLPGYGYARVPGNVQRNWQAMMQAYLQHRDALVGVVQLLDCRHAPTQQDRQMVQWLLEVDLPFCLVLTKMDKLKQGQRGSVARHVVQALSEDVDLPDDLPILPTSSRTGEGMADLLRWIDWALQQAAGVE
jgi:GTP-binding protein